MADTNNINIVVSAKDLASKTLKDIKRNAKEIGDAGQKGATGFGAMTAAVTVGNIAAGAFLHVGQNVISTLTNIGTASYNTAKNFVMMGLEGAANLEQLEVTFTTMLGSAEEAEKLIKGISEAAKATPFNLPELQNATKLLLNYGFTQDNVIDNMKMLGDVAAGTGANFSDLATYFGRAKNTGKIFTMEFDMFADRGIPIAKELAEVMGVAQSEVRGLASEGISFKDLNQAFENMTENGGVFHNMMISQSNTLNGVISNLQDGIFNMSVEFVKSSGIFDGVKMAAQFLLNVLDRLGGIAIPIVQDSFKTLGDIMNTNVVSNFTNAKDSIDSIAQGIAEGIGSVIQHIMNFINGFVAGFTENFNAMKEIVGNIIGSISDIFAELGGQMGNTKENAIGLGDNMGGALAEGVRIALEFLEDLFEQLADPDSDLRGFINSVKVLATQDMPKFVDTINNDVIPALKTLWDIISPVVALLSKFNKEAGASGGNMNKALTRFGGVRAKIPKFSTGADFIVPPGFNNDSFPMMVESGEHVKVTPKNEMGQTNNDNRNVTINIQGQQQDPQAFASYLAFNINKL